MALSFAQKEAIVAEVAEVAKSAYSAVGAEYRGLTVEQMTDLRVEARRPLKRQARRSDQNEKQPYRMVLPHLLLLTLM